MSSDLDAPSGEYGEESILEMRVNEDVNLDEDEDEDEEDRVRLGEDEEDRGRFDKHQSEIDR